MGKEYLQFDLTSEDDPEVFKKPFEYAVCAEKCDQYSHSIAKYCIPYFSGPHEST